MIDFHLDKTLPIVAWIAVGAAIACGVVIALSRRSDSSARTVVDRVVFVWFVAVVAAVVMFTLQPGPGGYGAALPAQLSPTSRLRPPDARANALLYLPVGFFAAVVWRSKARPVVWATGLSLSLSLAIELAQLVLPISRSAELHDVLFNSLGGFAGGLLGCLVVRLDRVRDLVVPDRVDSD